MAKQSWPNARCHVWSRYQQACKRLKSAYAPDATSWGEGLVHGLRIAFRPKWQALQSPQHQRTTVNVKPKATILTWAQPQT